MAGGPHAGVVVCWTCANRERRVVKATRVTEGVETDWYACEHGHRFGIDYSHSEPPSKPEWPLSPEAEAELLALVDMAAAQRKQSE